MRREFETRRVTLPERLLRGPSRGTQKRAQRNDKWRAQKFGCANLFGLLQSLYVISAFGMDDYPCTLELGLLHTTTQGTMVYLDVLDVEYLLMAMGGAQVSITVSFKRDCTVHCVLH